MKNYKKKKKKGTRIGKDENLDLEPNLEFDAEKKRKLLFKLIPNVRFHGYIFNIISKRYSESHYCPNKRNESKLN